MIEDILSEETLCHIAGARTKTTLRAWLDENRIPYINARSGWPRVHRKALEKAMGVLTQAPVAKKVDFNFDAIK